MEKETNKKQAEDKLLDASFLIVTAGFVVVFVALGLTWRGDGERLGVVGDFFGGVLNPIVAFVALLWIMVGVRMQRRELAAAQHAIAAQLEVSAITTLVQVDLVGETDAKKRINELDEELKQAIQAHEALIEDYKKEIQILPEKKESSLYPIKLYGFLQDAERKVNQLNDELNSQKERIVELKRRRETYAERLHKLAPGLADKS